MSLGYPTTKTDIDSKAGGLAVQLRNVLAEASNLKLWLDSAPDQDLVDRGYELGEIAQLRSAVADLDKLNQIYLGQTNQASTYDFRSFAKVLTGMA